MANVQVKCVDDNLVIFNTMWVCGSTRFVLVYTKYKKYKYNTKI